jgi:RNA polymerase sigma factor (sigma-70 family)
MKRINDFNPHLGHKDEVIPEYMYLARKVAYDYTSYCKHYSVEYGDFVGEAFVGLVKAFNSYDPTKHEAQFKTFAVNIMRNEISRFIRDKINIIRIPRKEKLSIQEMVLVSLNWSNPDSENSEEIQNKLPSNDDLSYLVNNLFFEILSNEEKKIVSWLIQGLKQTEVAAKLGISRQYLWKKTTTIRSKFSEFNNQDNSYNNEMRISK